MANVSVERHVKLVKRVAALERAVAKLKSKPIAKPAKGGKPKDDDDDDDDDNDDDDNDDDDKDDDDKDDDNGLW